MSHFVILGALALVAADVDVSLIRGEPIQGGLVSLSPEEVVIATGDGETIVRSTEILKVDLARDLEDPLEPAKGEAIIVELTDGSQLLATHYSVEVGRALIRLVGGGEMKTGTRSIASVRFKSQEGELRKQWREIRDDAIQGDVIVIRKTNKTTDGDAERVSTALDHLEGVLKAINTTSVGFDFDDTEVEVPREKVEGVIYYHPRATSSHPVECVVTDMPGSHWNARSVKLKDNKIELICVAGVRTSLPLERVRELDFSVGNLDYLSDLTHESIRWRPRNPLGVTPSLVEWCRPKTDVDRNGGPLMLDGVSYAKGLALHSHTEISYRLAKDYQSLLATVGIDENYRHEGNMNLVVVGDDRILYEQRIAGDTPVLHLDLDVSGVRRLKIVVEFGEDDADRGDNLNLCNARLTK